MTIILRHLLWLTFSQLVMDGRVKAEKCPDTKTNLTAGKNWKYLFSPGFPRNYINSVVCGWQLYSGGSDLSLEVNWMLLNVERSPGCETDFAQIYRGIGRNGELLDHRCGRSVVNVLNIGRYGYIYLQTDGANTTNSFKLKYRATYTGTNICLSPKSLSAHPYQWRIFTSPYYPQPYVNGLACHWVLTTDDPVEVIRLKFVDFDVEYSHNCSKDYVLIYDGGTPAANKLAKVCGVERKEFRSSGRKMYITLQTDLTDQVKGFKAMFISEQRGATCVGVIHLTAHHNKKQYLTSPNYPHLYAGNMSCSWQIMGSGRGQMIIAVIDSDIQFSEGCLKDYVEIYLGSSRHSPIFGRWCGGTRRKFYASSIQVYIHFHTDSSLSGRGFQLVYYMVQAPKTCPQKITYFAKRDHWQYFTSPFYPTVYEGNLTCEWLLESRGPNDLIELHVLHSEIEESPNCRYDSLNIYDGKTSNSNRLAKFCGTQQLSFISANSSLFIQFLTDNSYEYRGFRIKYISRSVDSICGSDFSLTAQRNKLKYLASPNMKSPLYRSLTVCQDTRLSPFDQASYIVLREEFCTVLSVRCDWVLTAEVSTDRIQLNVVFSSLTDNSYTCNSTYLLIYDGLPGNSNLLAKFCRNDTASFMSTNHRLSVVLYLGQSNQSNVIFVSYSSLPKHAIGEEIILEATRKRGYFSNVPLWISNNRSNSCLWIINANNKSSIVRLEIISAEFNPSAAANCSSSYIAVHDGNSSKSNLLGRFCDYQKSTFLSSGRQMFVHLLKNYNQTSNFVAVYYTEPKAFSCVPSPFVTLGMIFVERSCTYTKQLQAQMTEQHFSMMHFQLPYGSSTRYCTWYIESAGSLLPVMLEFVYVNLQPSLDCKKEYIAVYDGPANDTKNQIGKFCERRKPYFVSKRNSLFVVFFSEFSNVTSGFLARYIIIQDLNLYSVLLSSPGPARKQRQYISSPDFVRAADVPVSRTWKIEAANPSEVIVLQVMYSEIEESNNCSSAYTSVYDGSSSVDRLLLTWCNKQKPVLASTGPRMFIVYRAQWSSTSRGFLAAFYTKTTASVRGDSSNISTVCIILFAVLLLGGAAFLAWAVYRKWLKRRNRAQKLR